MPTGPRTRSKKVPTAAAQISVRGARTHNLRNVDIDLPRDALTVITGVSGSGKSSLAFDTIYAEGQRQYLDSLSPFARQFIDAIPRPPVESVVGLPPTLCIDQRQASVSPRSTLGTVSEIQDYVRLLMARVATPHCPTCGQSVVQQSSEEILAKLQQFPSGTALTVLAPVVRDRKGGHREVIDKLTKAGLVRAWIDGELVELETPPELAPRRSHRIEAVCDRVMIRDDRSELASRLAAAVRLALSLADGFVSVRFRLPDTVEEQYQFYSTKFACSACGTSFPEVEPRLFSFNSPQGACPTCEGMGHLPDGDEESPRRGRNRAVALTSSEPCPSCRGARLRPEALAFTLGDQSIAAIAAMPLDELAPWLASLRLSEWSQRIAAPLLTAIGQRLAFLEQVGVGYLHLDRPAQTLSGGELQRVRLATSLGSGLVGVCYVLDEPSIGLHPRDSERLIDSLIKLRDQGNTLLVVEHDEAMMRAADRLVDMGPGAGPEGGEIVAQGTPKAVASVRHSLTGAYLRGEVQVATAAKELPPIAAWLRLRGARQHNLQRIDAEVPLGRLVGISGVSGSGKSTLISQTLVPAVTHVLAGMPLPASLALDGLEGMEAIDKLIVIDQKSLGRHARSTPATYTGIWDEVRKVLSQSRDAKQRGYGIDRFSFNSGPGRCETCQGLGQQKIEMNFLSELFVRCPACQGRRFNAPTLQVRYKGKNAAELLELSIAEALEFFENFDRIAVELRALSDVGLGYLRLGQASQTLSGGEAQRIKLASELARRSTGRTLYVLDEPTTGLHFDDVARLLRVLRRLVDAGNTVVVIEHHVDVLRACDWLIDLGPDAGVHGGEIVAAGPPSEVAKSTLSRTAAFLR